MLLAFFTAAHISERGDLGTRPAKLFNIAKHTFRGEMHSGLWHRELSLGNSGGRLFTGDRGKPSDVAVMSVPLLACLEHAIWQSFGLPWWFYELGLQQAD